MCTINDFKDIKFGNILESSEDWVRRKDYVRMDI
jgi:hypothetical protein